MLAPNTVINLDDLHPLTPDQQKAERLLGNHAQHVCLVGGSRSGKTTLIVRSIVARALHTPGSRHLVTRFRANAVRASVWLDTFPKVMSLWFPHIKTVEHKQDGYEAFPNGSELWFGGLDQKERVEKILGQEYSTIFASECSQIPYSSIITLRTRLAQNVGLRLRGWYDLNPTSTSHWTNLEFGEKIDPISRLKLKNPNSFERMFLNPEGNRKNLSADYFETLENLPEQYRLRFYEGKYVTEIEGALWTSDLLELSREDEIKPGSRDKLAEFRRIVVAVDPSGSKSKADIKSDEVGIVVGARRHKNSAVILQDASMRGSPKEWARASVACYKKWNADLIVAEANYGGEMVRETIRSVDSNIPVKLVSATRGKVVRAEPVSALYEEDKVSHAGRFPELESQLCQFTSAGYMGDRSPDRADAAIWAITELMLGDHHNYSLAGVS